MEKTAVNGTQCLCLKCMGIPRNWLPNEAVVMDYIHVLETSGFVITSTKDDYLILRGYRKE